jgi:hypothetical protein
MRKRLIVDRVNRVLARMDIMLARPSEMWHFHRFLGEQPRPPELSGPGRPAYLHSFGAEAADGAHDFAVVMAAVPRPTIVEAVRSVFAQDFQGRVQILVGIDQPEGDLSIIETLGRECPQNHTLIVLDPGYSTSVRHGGLNPSWAGGVLRTVLSYLAASRWVAYLDDDNWWAPTHLSAMRAAIEGYDWAWTRRFYVNRHTRKLICEDEWESIGPHAGSQKAHGGWVDTNCLAIDKLACEAVLRWWSIPLRNHREGRGSDRNVFHILNTQFRGNGTGKTTVYYALNESDPGNDERIARIGRARYLASGFASD